MLYETAIVDWIGIDGEIVLVFYLVCLSIAGALRWGSCCHVMLTLSMFTFGVFVVLVLTVRMSEK